MGPHFNLQIYGWLWLWFCVFNSTFNTISVISCRSVLLVEETGVPEKPHQYVARQWQTFSRNVVSNLHFPLNGGQTYNFSCKSIYHTSLKLPVGVSPLQLVNLHRNRRYFVIKLHTWFCLSYFLKAKTILLHLSIFYENQQFFQHRICFSIQPPDYSDPWPTLARSTSFFS